ncbi:cytochrome b [Paraburkholderia heleia]|uniref:cytochrome b n=1 Tax=Paraburkholderia heleia TaxID=634127 RepID=UPI0005A7B219|nr:cytochrome b [Paraburkholderia heleia]
MPTAYTRTAITLHWLIALLIVCGFALGWVMTDIPGFTPTKLRCFSWHKWIGVTVLALAALRLLWRATHVPPALSDNVTGLQRVAAHGVHHLLYLLMFAVPLTGYFYSSAAGIPVVYLGLVPLPSLINPNPALRPVLREAHVLLDYTLLAVVVLHVLGALKHRFFDRDDVLSRMLPFLK